MSTYVSHLFQVSTSFWCGSGGVTFLKAQNPAGTMGLITVSFVYMQFQCFVLALLEKGLRQY
jgi:hypothetical protein